jgi:hypothetical protein
MDKNEMNQLLNERELRRAELEREKLRDEKLGMGLVALFIMILSFLLSLVKE